MDRETISGIVRESLEKAFDELHGQSAGDGEWTYEVKTRLCRAGTKQGLYVCAKDVRDADKDNGEWLYDVCWLRYDEANPPSGTLVDPLLDNLKEVVLIVESEWAKGGSDLGQIRDDFQKLLVGRARVRCMIWQDTKEQDNTVVNWLAGMMSRYLATASDDFYLLARYTDEGFQYWHLYGNGTVERVLDVENG